MLFDELGAGTDPTERCSPCDRDPFQPASPRFPRYGNHALQRIKGVCTFHTGRGNGCCEFDVETLRPTYRLLIGVPGKSNAFAISQKLGLSQDIIEEAKTHLTKQDEDFEDLLADLEQKRVTIEQERDQINSYKEEIRELKQRLESKQEKLDLSRDKILREANEQARNILPGSQRLCRYYDPQFPEIWKGCRRVCQRHGKGTRQLREKMSTVDKKLSAKNAAPKNRINSLPPKICTSATA